jgi:hypothetical protein
MRLHGVEETRRQMFVTFGVLAPYKDIEELEVNKLCLTVKNNNTE